MDLHEWIFTNPIFFILGYKQAHFPNAFLEKVVSGFFLVPGTTIESVMSVSPSIGLFTH